MKNNHIINAIFAFLVFFGLASCDDRELVQVDNSTAPIVMNLSNDSIKLDQNYPDNPVLNVTWSQATYTVPAEINYKIEASATADFKKPFTISTVSQSLRTATYTVGQVNTAAQTLGLATGVKGKLFLRVSSYLGAENLKAVSNVTNVQVTPYALEYPTFYLVGAASYVGWNSGVAQELYKKDNMSYIYSYLGQDEFRFLGQQAWDPVNYSLDNPSIKAAYRYFKQTSTNIIMGGSDENMKFTAPAGIYKISIDADGNVQSIDAKASAQGFDYANIYAVGTINGWDAATAVQMTKIKEGVFELVTNLTDASELKFLGQQSWTGLEWGNILKNNDGNSGFLGPKDDNSNIKFNGGGSSYKITVDLKAGTHKFVKQ